jgi:hypothetical protein
LIAVQSVFSSVEASQTHPDGEQAPAHDAYTRLLQRLPPDSQALWQEGQPLADRKQGVLVVDDSTLDKPYASPMALVSRHWSGKHHAIVQGINLISLVWTDRDCRLPCDFRIYHKSEDGLSKNDHFQELIQQAAERGFTPSVWRSGRLSAWKSIVCRPGFPGLQPKTRSFALRSASTWLILLSPWAQLRKSYPYQSAQSI